MKLTHLLPLLLALLLPAAQAERVQLRILQTTDLHTSALNYDYYRDAVDDTLGLSKVATLIRQARAEARNHLERKYRYLVARQMIATAEDFVALVGTSSTRGSTVTRAMGANCSFLSGVRPCAIRARVELVPMPTV